MIVKRDAVMQTKKDIWKKLYSKKDISSYWKLHKRSPFRCTSRLTRPTQLLFFQKKSSWIDTLATILLFYFFLPTNSPRVCISQCQLYKRHLSLSACVTRVFGPPAKINRLLALAYIRLERYIQTQKKEEEEEEVGMIKGSIRRAVWKIASRKNAAFVTFVREEKRRIGYIYIYIHRHNGDRSSSCRTNERERESIDARLYCATLGKIAFWVK